MLSGVNSVPLSYGEPQAEVGPPFDVDPAAVLTTALESLKAKLEEEQKTLAVKLQKVTLEGYQTLEKSHMGKTTSETEEKIPIGDMLVSTSAEMAHVGMKIAMTKNLGNYNSFKLEVSLILPCDNNSKDIDSTAEVITNWLEQQMVKGLSDFE